MGTLNNFSPLRYPGGKAAIADVFISMLDANGISRNGVYCEPFAGGAGVALTLLMKQRINRIIINDIDPCVAAFWMAILDDTARFLDLLADVKVTMDEWFTCRHIYKSATRKMLKTRDSRLKLGFATFFLNRTNRSGILPNAGPIGGWNQQGRYKIDARFKKNVLAERITAIQSRRDSIVFTSYDAMKFLDRLPKLTEGVESVFLYLDPPYYQKGSELYLNCYNHSDHELLAKRMTSFSFCPWVMTYDDCPEVRNLYGNRQDFQLGKLELAYSVQQARRSAEILIAQPSTKGAFL